MRIRLCAVMLAAAAVFALVLMGCSGGASTGGGTNQADGHSAEPTAEFDSATMAQVEYSGIEMSVPTGWEESDGPYGNAIEYRDASGMTILLSASKASSSESIDDLIADAEFSIARYTAAPSTAAGGGLVDYLEDDASTRIELASIPGCRTSYEMLFEDGTHRAVDEYWLVTRAATITIDFIRPMGEQSDPLVEYWGDIEQAVLKSVKPTPETADALKSVG